MPTHPGHPHTFALSLSLSLSLTHTHTHTENYAIFIACPLQKLLRERVWMLRYTYISCIVCNDFFPLVRGKINCIMKWSEQPFGKWGGVDLFFLDFPENEESKALQNLDNKLQINDHERYNNLILRVMLCLTMHYRIHWIFEHWNTQNKVFTLDLLCLNLL
jgi:hypothetical protein